MSIKIIRSLESTFSDYATALQFANKNNLPLFDTRQLPDRYFVGHPSIEMEEDADNLDWEQVFYYNYVDFDAEETYCPLCGEFAMGFCDCLLASDYEE
jgi:hypothetical protein